MDWSTTEVTTYLRNLRGSSQKDLFLQFYRDNTYDLNTEGHDPGNLEAAFSLAMKDTYGTNRIACGIFYQSERPCYEETEEDTLSMPVVDHKLGISSQRAEDLKARFK